ncbi:hypothetical protein Pfo_005090 [Paulownia fortunei]|nr:hypothetical protein Pfo_005090 [Paulownia fortunei]
MQLNPTYWGSLLGACRTYGYLYMVREVARRLFEIELDMKGNYVLITCLFERLCFVGIYAWGNVLYEDAKNLPDFIVNFVGENVFYKDEKSKSMESSYRLTLLFQFSPFAPIADEYQFCILTQISCLYLTHMHPIARAVKEPPLLSCSPNSENGFNVMNQGSGRQGQWNAGTVSTKKSLTHAGAN